MGGCYSKSGHELDNTNLDKRPKDKKKGSQKNGHIGHNHKPKFLIEDFDCVQKDVSDTVYTEDSQTFNGLEVDNLLHKSQQTSLDMLAKDINRNSDTLTACDLSEPGDTQNSSKEISHEFDDTFHVIEPKDVTEDKVVASDSGVVLESVVEPKQSITLNCANMNKPVVNSSNIPTKTDGEELQTQCQNQSSETKQDCIQTSCSQTNSSVKDSITLVNSHQTEHSTCTCSHGECPGHLFLKRSSLTNRLYMKGSSETLLKSSLKKGKHKPRQKKGLSWKSADSLDYVESMATSLDRTKSICSSILGDDISLLNAPLATFDSVDFAIGNSYDFSRLCESKPSKNNYAYPDCDRFQFDFFGIKPNHAIRQSVGSIDELSDSYKLCDSNTDSTSDLDKLKLAVRQSTCSTPADQWSLSDSLDACYDIPSIQSQPIHTMNMNGRDVVVIDQELFTQIMDEVQFLKMKLSQLTDVIQESDCSVTECTALTSSTT